MKRSWSKPDTASPPAAFNGTKGCGSPYVPDASQAPLTTCTVT